RRDHEIDDVRIPVGHRPRVCDSDEIPDDDPGLPIVSAIPVDGANVPVMTGEGLRILHIPRCRMDIELMDRPDIRLLQCTYTAANWQDRNVRRGENRFRYVRREPDRAERRTDR